MTDRLRPLSWSSNSNIKRHRSHSCRGKTTRTTSDLHNQTIERIQRRFEQELDQSKRELQWTKQRNSSFSSPIEYVEKLRIKLKNNYNQLMQEKIEEIEKYMNIRYNKELRLSQRKLRKTQIENEKYHLQSINKIVREQDAICKDKLAVQRSYYNQLLEEQTQRLRAEQTLQSFEYLNIGQLKDRLTRVENSNYELKQIIHDLINQQPIYRSTVYIPNIVV